MERELPEGWVEVELSEICLEVQKVTPENAPDEYFNYIDIASVDNEKNKVTEAKSIIGAEAPSRARQLVKVGDTVFSTVRTYLKNIAFVTDEFDGSVASTGFAVIRPIERIENKFVFYYTLSDLFLEPLNQLQRGISYPAVKSSVVFGQPFPLPPLAEQKRIVAKLDETFQHLDTLKAKLERIPEILKNFRQSVLTQAITGKLTKSDVEEWENSTLAEVIVEKPKNGYSARPVGYETHFRVLTLTATTSGVFNPNFFKYFDEEISADSPFWLQPNDIVIQRGNTIDYVGVPAIYDDEPNQFIYPDLMIKVRAKESVILTKFLYLLLSSKESRSYLRERATGTTGNMPKINQPTLLSLPVKFPTLEEQKEIVKRVEALFAKADAIEGYYATLKEKIDKLPQALLAKAFRGELVPQNPIDEPASVLLEKIKAAKAGAAKTAKGKKAKGGKQGELVL